MKVLVARSFLVALDNGNRVVRIEEGAVVEDEFVAGVALRGGHGQEVEATEKAAEAAPANRDLGAAPSSKRGRKG